MSYIGNIYIYMQILIDCKTNMKVRNYLNLLFKKNFISINKPTIVPHNNAAIIDHIDFLNNDMSSWIITADISDHFPVFLISENLILNSSNELIHLTKQEINDKSSLF